MHVRLYFKVVLYTVFVKRETVAQIAEEDNAGRGSVMLWTLFCLQALGPCIYVDATFTQTTYLNIAADQGIPLYRKDIP